MDGLDKNDVPQEIENGIITIMDDNGQKVIVLPADSEYELVFKATADGTMTVSTSKYIQAESVSEMVTSYYELPLKAGTSYESVTTETEFRLTNSSGVVITPSVVQSGADIKFYKVDLSVEGNGESSGINTYSVGEFAKVTAYPSEGETFLGWYKNGSIGKKAFYNCKKLKTITIKSTMLKSVGKYAFKKISGQATIKCPSKKLKKYKKVIKKSKVGSTVRFK